MKKLVLVLLVAALIMTVGEAFAEKKYTIGTVVKVDGIAWFDRMREGVTKFGKTQAMKPFYLARLKQMQLYKCRLLRI